MRIGGNNGWKSIELLGRGDGRCGDSSKRLHYRLTAQSTNTTQFSLSDEEERVSLGLTTWALFSFQQGSLNGPGEEPRQTDFDICYSHFYFY